MSDDGRWAVLIALAGYNIVQNMVIPAGAYVPANLAASLSLVQLARRYGCSLADVGLGPNRVIKGLRLGVAASLTVAALAVAVSLHPRASRYLLDDRAAGHDGGGIAYRSLVRFPLGTALFEEVAFRGVVYGVWRRAGASQVRAAAVTSAAFGIWHLIPAARALTGNPLRAKLSSRRSRIGVVVLGALVTAISSFGLTWLRVRSEGLIAPWLAHAAVNSAGYLAGVRAWQRAI
ncbi:MAG: CPBP family intramembrane glutamic endopeptidase [Acidimicrobiia bacterium]